MLVSFSDLRSLYGMPYLTPASEDQYTNLLLTAEDEVLAYAGIREGKSVEYFDAVGSSAIMLCHHPVKSVEVTVSGEPMECEYDPELNRVLFHSAVYGRVKVEETLGYSEEDVPRIVKQCIALTVQYWAKVMNSNLIGVSNRSTDAGNETVEQFEIPLVVKTALDRFRTVAV